MTAHADESPLPSPVLLMSTSERTSADTTHAGRGRRVFREKKCAYCQKVFKRSEHCIRHQRTHTNERPYSCRYCLKSYARKDLVTRHERTLHAQAHAEDRLLAERLPDGEESPDETPGKRGNSEGQWRALVDAAVSTTDNATDNATDNTIANAASNEDHPADTAISKSMLATLGDSPSSLNSFGASPDQRSGPYSAGSSSSMSSNSPPGADQTVSSICPETEDIQLDLYLEDGQGSGSTMTSPATIPPVSVPDTQYAPRTSQGIAGLLENFSVYNVSEHVPMQTDLNLHQQDNPVAEQCDQFRRLLFVEPFEQHHGQETPSTGVGHGQPLSGVPAPAETMEMHGFTFSPISDASAGMANDSTLFHLQDFMELQDLSSMQLDLNAHDVSLHTAHLPGSQGMSVGSPSSVAPHHPFGPVPLAVDARRHSAPPAILFDSAAYDCLRTDLTERLGCPHLARQLPPARMCQSFFSSFLESFHCHFPMIHLRTLDLNCTPSPLILAMCSIGAVYRLDRRRARRLYNLAREEIENLGALPSDGLASITSPLWLVQTRVLLTTYATLSGDSDLASTAINENGLFTLMYGKIRQALADDKADLESITWEKWAQRESQKRLLAAIFVLSALMVVIYDVNPGFGTTQDLELEMLHGESLWVATADEWQALRAKQVSQDNRSVKDILAELLSSDNKTNPVTAPAAAHCRVSPFFALFLMHAVLIHMRQLTQITQVIGRTSSAQGGAQGDDSVSLWLRRAASKSLSTCQQFLQANRNDTPDNDVTSLIFSCETVLRMARIRLFSCPNAFNRLSLLERDPSAVQASVSTFVASELDKSQDLLDAVDKSLEGFKLSIKMGYMLVRKTAALRWSVEHAVAGWDSAQFTSKWVHSVEMSSLDGIQPTSAENALLASLREVLEEADYELGEAGSLAAGVVRVSGSFLKDLWVWGITPQMGEILEQIASAYDRANQAGRRSANISRS